MGNKKEFNKLKKIILKKAKIKKGDVNNNIKLGSMGVWSMLFGSCDWYIPELDITVKGTCGGCCKGCFDPEYPEKSPCYVAKSYSRHTYRNEDGSVGNIQNGKCSVKLGHAYRTLAMTMFRKDLLVSLDYQLMRMKDKFETVRINESGEITCFEDLELWCSLAIRHPETNFYLYTKNYKSVRKAIRLNIIPKNLFINISVWHKQGIKEYLEFASHQQIRAFVLVDDVWTREEYALHGLVIDGMCGAYDYKGKMNHEVTCDKCKKCFSNRCKVTGCFEH